MKRYFAKPDTWYKAGTEVFLEEDLSDSDGTSGYRGWICRGTYIVSDTGYDGFWYAKGYKVGDEVEMRELCNPDEFNVVEEE